MGTGWPRLGLKMREELDHAPPRLDGTNWVVGEENWIPLSVERAGWLAALSRGDVTPFSEPIALWKRLLRSSSSLVSCPEALRSMASFVCVRNMLNCGPRVNVPRIGLLRCFARFYGRSTGLFCVKQRTKQEQNGRDAPKKMWQKIKQLTPCLLRI